MEDLLKDVRQVYPEATINKGKDGRADGLYFAPNHSNYGMQVSYITTHEFTDKYFLFLDGIRIPSKSKDKILAVLKSIKEASDE